MNSLMLAGRFRRLLATGIDAILVPALSVLLVMITDVMEDAEDFQDNWWMLHVLLLAIFSYLLLNGYGLWKSGQTLGKKVMGIAIVSAASPEAERYPITPAPLWRLILIRALFFPTLFVFIVPWLVWIPILDQLFIFTPRRRCLHDLAAGTIVVRLEKDQN